MRIRNSQAAAAANAADVFVTARTVVDETLSQLAASFNSHAPALKLPSELVLEVASCLEQPRDRTAVSGACRGWREMLLSEVRLWNTFKWHGTYHDPIDNFQQFHWAVDRSFRGGHPVDVDLSFDGYMHLGAYLQPLPHVQLRRLSVRRADDLLEDFSWFPTFLNVTSLSISDLDSPAFLVDYVVARLFDLFPAVVNLHLHLSQFYHADIDSEEEGNTSLRHLHLACDLMAHGVWNKVIHLYLGLHTLRIDSHSLYPMDYGLYVHDDTTSSLEHVFLSSVVTYEPLDFQSLEPIQRVTIASTQEWDTQPWSLLVHISRPTALSCRATPTSTALSLHVMTSLKIRDAQNRTRHLQVPFSDEDSTIIDAVQTWLATSSFVVVKLDLQFVWQFLGSGSFSFTSMRDLVIWYHPHYASGWKALSPVVVPALKRVTVRGTGPNPVEPAAGWFEWLLSGMNTDAAAREPARPTLELVWPIRISEDALVRVQDYTSSVHQVWTRTA